MRAVGKPNSRSSRSSDVEQAKDPPGVSLEHAHIGPAWASPASSTLSHHRAAMSGLAASAPAHAHISVAPKLLSLHAKIRAAEMLLPSHPSLTGGCRHHRGTGSGASQERAGSIGARGGDRGASGVTRAGNPGGRFRVAQYMALVSVI
jgi:hypothetical protein